MNKTFVTNTHIAPIVDVSTYDGPFSYEYLWEGYESAEREEGRLVCDDYDSSKMEDRIVEEANMVFEAEKPLSQYGVVSIKATKFGSPREYNFMSDWLDLEVEVYESFFDKARTAIFDPENRKAIVEHCKDHWVSKDGFHSFMLNRVQNLSLNWWEHRHYGRHMATDEEVEEAVLADLQEVLTFLETETSEDEYRDFGAILALLWRFEYPGDFQHGSWVTDEMVENLQGNSSLSDFCTVLERDELAEKVGDSLIAFDTFIKELEQSYEKYVKSGVGEASQARAKAWLEIVRKDVKEFEDRQRRYVESYAPKWDSVRDALAELREEWDAKLEIGWPGAWK